MAADASVAGMERGESTAPGAASAARAGVGCLVLLGDPPSFDEDDSDPHCCVKPHDAVAPAVACGDRGVSESTWAAGLLFGADGVAVTVSLDRTAGDASLATATTSSATTVSASMQDICRVPSRPANVPEVSRGRRLPCLDVRSARQNSGWHIRSIRPRRPSMERHGASVPTRVHLPLQLRHTRVSRNCDSAPGRRHPRAMAAAPAPDFHRPAGLPVCRDGSRQRRHRAAPTWPLQ